jgi:hypothetical protein
MNLDMNFSLILFEIQHHQQSLLLRNLFIVAYSNMISLINTNYYALAEHHHILLACRLILQAVTAANDIREPFRELKIKELIIAG